MTRPPSKGRQRIAMERIADKARCQVTFSKRKHGVLKKAIEIALLCGARVAVIIFSSVGTVFATGSPSVDGVLRRLAPLPGEEGAPHPDDDDDADRAAVEATLRQAEEARALVAAEQARMAAVGEKVLKAVPPGRSWWEADVEQLGEAELPEFAKALHRLRDNVQRHANKLRAHAPLPLQ